LAIHATVKSEAHAEAVKTFDDLLKRFEYDILHIGRQGEVAQSQQRQLETLGASDTSLQQTDGSNRKPTTGNTGNLNPERSGGQRRGGNSELASTPRDGRGVVRSGEERTHGQPQGDSAVGSGSVQRLGQTDTERGTTPVNRGEATPSNGRRGDDSNNGAREADIERTNHPVKPVSPRVGLGEEKVSYPKRSASGTG